MIYPHVIPVEDLREHQESHDCWCKPEFKDRKLLHNALDGRQFMADLNVQRGELSLFLAQVSQAYLDPYRFTNPKDCSKNVFIALKWLDKRAGLLKVNPLIDNEMLISLSQFIDCWLFIDEEV